MKKLIAGLAAAAAMLFGPAALASTCPALPYTFSNGSVADATQVMAEFNALLNCLNLNVAPLASPTFTGTVTAPTLSVGGNATISGSATVSGTASVSGAATLSGGLSVSGSTGNGVVYMDAGALSSTAGTSLDLGRFHFTATNNVNLRFFANRPSSGTDWTTAPVTIAELVDSTQEAFIVFSPAGNAGGLGFGSTGGTYTSMSSTGLWTFGAGIAVQGPVTLPAASVVNADLDTVNSGSGACGSATAVCSITTNAQGRVTSQSATAIRPDTCATNANGSYCINAEGYMHQAGISGLVGATSSVTINLPGTCASAIDAVQATSTVGGTNSVSVTGWTTSQIVLRNNQSGSQQIMWAVDCH